MADTRGWQWLGAERIARYGVKNANDMIRWARKQEQPGSALAAAMAVSCAEILHITTESEPKLLAMALEELHSMLDRAVYARDSAPPDEAA